MECKGVIMSITSPLSCEEKRENPDPEERREVFWKGTKY